MKPLHSFLAGMVSSMLVIGLLVPRENSNIQISIAIPHSVGHHAPNRLDMVQLNCMAEDVFFEARGETVAGKEFAAQVVMERMKSPHFPHNVCDVVHEANHDLAGRIIRFKCQFSWNCDGQNHDIDLDNATVRQEWIDSYQAARMVMMSQVHFPVDTDGMTHYHNDLVKPFWAKDRKDYILVARVDHHLFYRWKKAKMPKWAPDTEIAMN